MDRIYLANAVQTAPAMPSAETSKGYPTDGSATSGQLATIPGSHWFHAVTEEIRNAIVAAGIDPAGNEYDQLSRAIAARIEARVSAAEAALDEAIEQIKTEVASDGISAGTYGFFDLDAPPSDKWIPCDGRALSRVAYAALFATIGTKHGAGDGSTTFNVPDVRGRVFEGSMTGIGELIEPALPNIKGRIGNFSDFTTRASNNGPVIVVRNGGFDGTRRGSWDGAIEIFIDASRTSPIYKDDVTTVQPAAIKTLVCIHV